MIRITKLTDYGIVLLSCIARDGDKVANQAGGHACNVRELAEESHLPLPTVSKLLKSLTRSGLLVSQRGSKGGYVLARRPEEITVAQIIGALDGPIAITDCSVESPENANRCELERLCPMRTNWQRINVALRDTMESLTLADMTRPLPAGFAPIRLYDRREKPNKSEMSQAVLSPSAASSSKCDVSGTSESLTHGAAPGGPAISNSLSNSIPLALSYESYESR